MNFDEINIEDNVFDPLPFMQEFTRAIHITDWLSDNETHNHFIRETNTIWKDNTLTFKCYGGVYNYAEYDCEFEIEFLLNQLIVKIRKHFDIEGFIYKLIELGLTHKTFKIKKIILPEKYCVTIENDLMFENILEHFDLIQFDNNNIYFPHLHFNEMWNKNETFALNAIKLLKEHNFKLIFNNGNNGIVLCLQRMNIPYKRRLMNEFMDIYKYHAGKYGGHLKQQFEFQ